MIVLGTIEYGFTHSTFRHNLGHFYSFSSNCSGLQWRTASLTWGCLLIVRFIYIGILKQLCQCPNIYGPYFIWYIFYEPHKTKQTPICLYIWKDYPPDWLCQNAWWCQCLWTGVCPKCLRSLDLLPSQIHTIMKWKSLLCIKKLSCQNFQIVFYLRLNQAGVSKSGVEKPE